MSQAFIREGDDMTLADVGPSLRALSVFLSRENNGIQVYLKSTTMDGKGVEIYLMSNGSNYAKDNQGKWLICS
jgi:hypothetical protein